MKKKIIKELSEIVNSEIKMKSKIVEFCFLKSQTIEEFTDAILTEMTTEPFINNYDFDKDKHKEIVKDKLLELLEPLKDKFVDDTRVRSFYATYLFSQEISTMQTYN